MQSTLQIYCLSKLRLWFMLCATGRLACHRWRMLNYTSKILGYKYLPNAETIIPAVVNSKAVLEMFHPMWS